MKKDNEITFKQKMKYFIKKNSYLLFVSACICVLVVALVITAVIKFNGNTNSNIGDVNIPDQNEEIIKEPTTPTGSDSTIIMVTPTKNYTMGDVYNSDSVIKNITLNQWETHMALDYLTTNSEEVVAVADGKIESIYYDNLEGKVIMVSHSGGLKSVYKSLADDVTVNVGDEVKCGDVIGYTGTTMGAEYKLGNHLHFELYLNDELVNPLDYLENK